MVANVRRVRQLAEHLGPSISNSGQSDVYVRYTDFSSGNKVATVTVSNPHKANIVDSRLLAKMTEAFRALATDRTLRAIILTGGATAPGKSPSFIGGADVGEMSQFSTAEQGRAFILSAHQVNAAIRECPVPVIARVHGCSLGAGLEMMVSCDLRLATKASTFAMPEVKVGIPSVIEAAYLPGLIGMGRTRQFLYLCETVDGITAEKWGLIEKVVDDESQLDSAVDEWVQIIISMGPQTITSQKRLMQKWENSTTDAAILAGAEAYGQSFADGGLEPKQYMAQFFNRKR